MNFFFHVISFIFPHGLIYQLTNWIGLLIKESIISTIDYNYCFFSSSKTAS